MDHNNLTKKIFVTFDNSLNFSRVPCCILLLQKFALFLFLYLRHGAEDGPDGLVEHGLEPLLRQGRAL